MRFGINFARRDDAVRIAEASRRYIETGLKPSWTPGRILSCIDHPDWTVIAASGDGGGMLGFAVMEYLDVHAHLALLAVLPGYRSKGIGRALVAWLEKSAVTAGTFTVRLELRAANEGALSFYSYLGYRVTGQRRGYYADREDALMMEHDLRIVQLGDAEPRL